MSVEIKKVEGKKDLNKFVRLQFDIYKDDPAWAPELLMDFYERLDRKHHPFFIHAKAEYWLAYRDGKVVGRIAAINNPNHNKHWNDKVGFWGLFECINDQEVANALFDTAKEWLKNEGKDVMRGPMSFSVDNEIAMVIEGFEERRYPVMPHNPPYYVDLCNGYKMKKAKDLLAFHLDLTSVINPKVVRIAEYVRKKAEKKGLTVRVLNKKKLREDIRMIMDIYHEAWQKNWGYVPMTDAEFKSMPESLAMITDKSLVIIIEDNGKPVAFAAAMYDIMEATHDLRHIDSRPLWWINIRQLIHLLRKLFIKPKGKRFKRGRLFLAGVKPGYRKMGLDALLYTLPFQAGKDLGLTDGELSWELEDNDDINSTIVKMGGKIYKKFRVWDKKIK